MRIIMLKGLPASLKSSWAREQQANNGNYVVISKDEIRKMFGGFTARHEKEVLRMRNEMIRVAIRMKKNVIVDDTNLNPKHERYLRQLAKELGVKFEVNDSFLESTPEECIERDLHRGDKAVGASVIWEQYFKWLCPHPSVRLNKEFDKPRAVICDLDGTLSLNLGKRSYYDLSRVSEDSIEPFVGCIVDALSNYGVEAGGDKYPKIIIVSGREETCKKDTEEWLERNCISYDELFMRKTNDRRSDDIVKEEIYHNEIEPFYSVLGVLEDRNRVCRMYRKLGLRVLQAGFPEVEF